jgi:hypothetical protein
LSDATSARISASAFFCDFVRRKGRAASIFWAIPPSPALLRRPGRIDIGRLSRRVHCFERFCETRRLEPPQGRGVDPFRHIRQTQKRRFRRPRDDARIEPLSQAIDRLDRRQPRKRFLVHHLVGMNHLQMAVPQLQLAGDPARRADRQDLLDPVRIGEEEHKFDVAGVVLD